MPKIWLGAIVVAAIVAAFYLWPTSQRREQARQDALQKEIAENQRKVEQAEAENRAVAIKRKEQASAIANASDEKLKLLYRECEKRVSDTINAASKPAFAVYFPSYTASELRDLATMATAMKTSTGRPSAILGQDDFKARRIEWLRQFPNSISLVAESASDSFSGVKKWAAEYECDLDGLSIKSVRRVGTPHFFD